MWDDYIIKAIVSSAFSIVCSIATYYWTKANQAKEEFNKLEKETREANERLLKIVVKADCAILRNTIRQACKKSIAHGYVPEDEREDIINCYEVYEELVEKNGYIDDCMHKFKKLPSQTPES